MLKMTFIFFLLLPFSLSANEMLEKKIDERLNVFNNGPGLAVLVIKDNKTLMKKAYGG